VEVLKGSRELRRARGSGGFARVPARCSARPAPPLLEEVALSARQIADQLSHAKVCIAQDNYPGRRL